MGERSRLQADLESTQAALKAKGNVKVYLCHVLAVI